MYCWPETSPVLQAFQSHHRYPDNVNGLHKPFLHAEKTKKNIKKARVLDYSVDVSKVWVKYKGSEEEKWSKFPLLMGATAPLPPPDKNKYDNHLPGKASKASDIWKIVNKSFYNTVQADVGLSSGTNVETDDHSD